MREFYPIAMSPWYYRDFVAFNAQLQEDRQAGIFGPGLTLARWMAAVRRRYEDAKTRRCEARFGIRVDVGGGPARLACWIALARGSSDHQLAWWLVADADVQNTDALSQ